LQVACELTELGAHLVEQRYRRDHPDAGETLSGPKCARGDSTVRVPLMVTPSVADATWTSTGDRAALRIERGFGRERDLVDLVDELRRDGAW